MANSFPAHSPPFHVLAGGFDSWCLLTESWFRTGCLQIPSALQQQMSGSFRKDLAASSPLFGVDQPPWLQETLNNRKRGWTQQTGPSMTQISIHFEHKAFIPSLFPLSLRSSTPWDCTCFALMASRLANAGLDPGSLHGAEVPWGIWGKATVRQIHLFSAQNIDKATDYLDGEQLALL